VRVGVTGSSGFIGSTLVAALEERGDHVVRFVRPGSPPTSGDVVRWDPARGVVDDADLRANGGFDAVVNLAGVGIADRRWSNAHKEAILRSRTDATSLLAQLLSRSSDTTFVASGSSIGIYGSRGDESLDESSRVGDDFLARVCVEWERATTALSNAGSPVAHVRTGIVMSRRGGALKKQLPLFRLGVGGAMGSGRQWISPISMRDEVRAIVWLLEHRVSGAFNLVAPAALTNRAFSEALARQLHRPSWLTVPSAALRIALGTELADAVALASQRVAPTALVESGFTFESPDVATILSSALA
jgi:uncharacterized protein (TIGR01777 family)